MIIFFVGDLHFQTLTFGSPADSYFVNLGEVFYDGSDATGHYISRWEKGTPPAIETFDEYLDYLRTDTEHLYWLHIKFHDLNRFNPSQRSIVAPPLMLQHIVKACRVAGSGGASPNASRTVPGRL